MTDRTATDPDAESPDAGRLVIEDGLPVRYVRRLPEPTVRDWLPFLV